MDAIDMVPYIMIGIVVLFVSVFGYAIFEDEARQEAIKQSCEDLGMEYYTSMDSKFCIDALDQAHYAKFTCDGNAWNKHCTARLISIGDIRMKEAN